jgi:hypothetical protein
MKKKRNGSARIGNEKMTPAQLASQADVVQLTATFSVVLELVQFARRGVRSATLAVQPALGVVELR